MACTSIFYDNPIFENLNRHPSKSSNLEVREEEADFEVKGCCDDHVLQGRWGLREHDSTK